MKKIFKVLSLVLVFMLAIAPLAISFAADTLNLEDATQIDLGDAEGTLSNWFATAIHIIQIVGYGIAVVMILWLGIQYMLAQPAKKAELKGKMWSMLIGIILLVGGVTIITVIWNAFGSNLG